LAYWWNKDLSNLEFDIDVNFPIFTTNPLGLSIGITWSEEISITQYVSFESVTFKVAAEPLSVTLDSKIKASFKANPTMYFEGSGTYKADNSVLLWGAMEGTWVSPFGIKGFDLSDVIVEFGFNPMLCALDGCVSDFGLGMQMIIGDKVIKFDGNVAAPDFMDVYLAGSISGGQGQHLAVLDVIHKWNQANPTRPVSTDLIPPSWGITDCAFYFAPEDGTFGPIHYTKGFGVTGDFVILNMPVHISVNCTEDAGNTCNFAFDAHINLDEFAKEIEKELGIIYPDRDVSSIFTLKDVSLTDWSQKDVSLGTKPRWTIDINVFNQDQILDFRVEQYMLSQSFHDFFNQWIKHIFHQ